MAHAAVGVLFELGFDAATEISLLGLSADNNAHGLSMASVLVFPVLFAAGMTKADKSGVSIIIGSYAAPCDRPTRSIGYDLAATLLSVVVAVLIGGIEVVGLFGDEVSLTGALPRLLDALNAHLDTLGVAAIATFPAN